MQQTLPDKTDHMIQAAIQIEQVAQPKRKLNKVKLVLLDFYVIFLLFFLSEPPGKIIFNFPSIKLHDGYILFMWVSLYNTATHIIN